MSIYYISYNNFYEFLGGHLIDAPPLKNILIEIKNKLDKENMNNSCYFHNNIYNSWNSIINDI